MEVAEKFHRDQGAQTGDDSGVHSLGCLWGRTPLCEEVGDDARVHMTALAEHVAIPKHRILFEEGSTVEQLYCVARGVLKLYKPLPDGRRQIVGFCYRGDFLGALVSGDRYIYTCSAVTPAMVCVFRKSLFNGIVRAHPEIKDCLLHNAIMDIAAAYEHIIRLGIHRSEEKLASFLMVLAQRSGEKRRGGIDLYLPMQRIDIADYLGVKPETVSRALSWLRDAGIIEIPSRHGIVIVRPDALAHIAQGDSSTELVKH